MDIDIVGKMVRLVHCSPFCISISLLLGGLLSFFFYLQILSASVEKKLHRWLSKGHEEKKDKTLKKSKRSEVQLYSTAILRKKTLKCGIEIEREFIFMRDT